MENKNSSQLDHIRVIVSQNKTKIRNQMEEDYLEASSMAGS